jgi:hypothetical protein
MKPELFRFPGSLFCTEAFLTIVDSLLEQNDFKIRIDYCSVFDAEGVDTLEELDELIEQVTTLSLFRKHATEFKAHFDWVDLRIIEYLDGPLRETGPARPSDFSGRYEVVQIELVDLTDIEITSLVVEPLEFVKELFETLCTLAQTLAERASSDNAEGASVGQYGPAQAIID